MLIKFPWDSRKYLAQAIMVKAMVKLLYRLLSMNGVFVIE